MHKRQFLQTAIASALAFSGVCAHAQTIDAKAVVLHYSALVHANYSDVLTSAQTLQKTITAFVTAPSAQGLEDAKKAWLAAREFYGQTEVFRFYSGPIDDDNGPEGRINAWPLDESYIDSVAGKPMAGLVNTR